MPYVFLVLLLTLGGVGAGGYFYISDLQERVETLKENNAKLEMAFETQKAEYENLQNDFALQTESLNELAVAKAEIQNEMNRYLDIFKRHDLTKLAAAKPGLIETLVNEGTKDVFDSIEKDSAAVSNSTD